MDLALGRIESEAQMISSKVLLSLSISWVYLSLLGFRQHLFAKRVKWC